MRTTHQLRLVAQALLDAPGDETYGFVLAQATGIKAGTLYPILQRLVAEGWLTSRWEEVDEHLRRRRRYYRLTALGKVNAEHVAVGRTLADWVVVGLSPENELLLEGPFASREDASAYAETLAERNPRDWRFWAQVLRIPDDS